MTIILTSYSNKTIILFVSIKVELFIPKSFSMIHSVCHTAIIFRLGIKNKNRKFLIFWRTNKPKWFSTETSCKNYFFFNKFILQTGSKVGKFTKIQVSDCDTRSAACILKKNSNATISIDFELSKCDCVNILFSNKCSTCLIACTNIDIMHWSLSCHV